MNTNAIADIVGDYLETKHSRVYRAKAPSQKAFPYVVYRVESVMDTYPSHDFYLNVDIYEDPNKSVRAVEDLADAIETGINHKVIIENGVNLQFEKEQRQSIDAQDLLGTYLVNIRFVVRGYFI
jgi:hypothetical protein